MQSHIDTNTDQQIINRQKDIKESRRELLDLLEIALAGSPSWPIVRAKVLEIFGRKGLQSPNSDISKNNEAAK